MNRKQRRALAQHGIDHKAIREVDMQAKRIATQQATNWAAASALLVLRDHFGFGEERAKRFMTAYCEVFDDLAEKRISFTDVENTIKDELKINLIIK